MYPLHSSMIAMLFLIPAVLAGGNDAVSDPFKLPEPQFKGDVSVEEALYNRRSIRSYEGKTLSLEQLSQLLWAAQGITHERGLRTAPSGGALYPLELYVVSGSVDGLEPGIYRYVPDGHSIDLVSGGDKRALLTDATLRQNFVGDAPASLVFTAVFKRITDKYGDRGVRYSYMEAGHAAQNVYLEGVALGVDTVVVGAFSDEKLKALICPAGEEAPLYIMPLGERTDR